MTICSSSGSISGIPPQQIEDKTATQKDSESVDGSPVLIPMSVEAGTPIKVALDSEVRIR